MLVLDFAAALEAERDAGWNEAIEATRMLAHKQGNYYFEQMEGQGEPSFGQLEFALAAANHIRADISALKRK